MNNPETMPHNEEKEQKNNLIPLEEIQVESAKSSGPGGQNVNKRETKAVVHWNVDISKAFSAEQKAIIKEKLANILNNEGELVLSCQDTRSQESNKTLAIDRLQRKVAQALEKKKERIPTHKPASADEARIREKKETGQLKKLRQKIDNIYE